MSERRTIHQGRSGRTRPIGRRAVVPPELLEPRNAPGVCLHLSWLTEAAPSALSDNSIVALNGVCSQSGDFRDDAAKFAAWPDKGDTNEPTNALDKLSLLCPDEAMSAVKQVGAPHTTRGQASELSAPVGVLVTQPVSTFVRGALSTRLPSIKTLASNKRDAAEELPALKVVSPVIAKAAATGGSGAGSSNSTGGGPPAGGGGRAATTTQPSPAAASAAIANSVVTTSFAAPPSAPTMAASATPGTAGDSRAATADPLAAPPLVAESPVVATLPTSAPTIGPLTTGAATAPATSSLSASSSLAALDAPEFAVAAVMLSGPVITQSDAEAFLDRASAATPRNDAIIAIVDRNGRILGVRVEDGVPIDRDSDTMIFAIDGAVAKARTAAFFSSDAAPLTSRTVRFISQTTIAQREVESNPNETDPTKQGPGFVAPIGLGGHFPPDVRFTPQVDLFAIEHTNRDSLLHPGKDAIRGTMDDVVLDARFGADFADGAEIPAPESYGVASGKLAGAQARGIATLPGGVPLFKRDPDDMNRPKLVGGIGVFFPGPDGYATFEQNFQHADARLAAGLPPQTTGERLNAPLAKQSEYMAFAAAGGVGSIAGIPLPADYVLPTGRIDLAGIKLEIYGPHPHDEAGLLAFGKKLGEGLVNGDNMQVTPGGDLFIDGQPVPDGWLVEPRASSDPDGLTEADVRQIIEDGVAEAMRVRAAIRLPLGSRTNMVLSVTDTDGEILGLFRMPDATFFSIDVAVAKARNVAYYADADALQPEDQIDDNGDGIADVPAGTALTNRTFRYLSTPFFPTGVDTAASGPFSILNDPGINPRTAENIGPALPADRYTSVLGYDAFNPSTNFRELSDAAAVPGNQNGIVFFPGSTALYKNGQLVGGFGVSGDGVDQDDVVTFGGAGEFRPTPNSGILRADEVFVRGVRLPYQKFSRNARG